MPRTERLRGLLRSECPFLVAFGLAVVVRVLVMVAFPPAFLVSDGPTYLGFVDRLFPSPDRPVGYGAFLRMLSWATRSLALVTATQLVLGLLTGVIAYALLRRWGVSPWVAMLASFPLLFDALQLMLEHAVLSDILFGFLVMLAVGVMAWWQTPRLWTTAAGGLLLGAATLVRIVGEPMILAAVLFLALAATTWRTRMVHAFVVCLAFALPVTVYAGWYHQESGTWAITETSGRALYMRTTGFVDCSTLSLPSYERTLCPSDPLSDRLDPTWYGWHDADTVPKLQPPAGVSRDQAMKDFAIRAIKAQPLDYLKIAARDFAMAFVAPTRVDH
nr:phospholipid carrier-dependent glycosyltransferase [Nocardioidaceae bacterium]